jgi:hypothetical protein
MLRAPRSLPQRIMNGVVLLLALSFLYGCGAVSKANLPSSKSSGKSSLVIAPAAAQIRAGDTQLFAANIGVTWSVNDIPGGNTTIGTIDGKGLYTAPESLPTPNYVKVTATSVADSSMSAAVPVTLDNPMPALASVSPTTVSMGSFTISVKGRGFVRGAQVLLGGTSVPTTFNSATQLTATGVATPAQLGRSQISVKNPDPGSATSTTSVNVQVNKAPAIQVSVSPPNTNLRAMDAQQFTATILGTSNSAATWSVNGVPGGNAALGTISPKGRYIAPATLPSPNSVTVAATSMVDARSSGVAVITFKPAAVTAPAASNYYVNGTTGDDTYDGRAPIPSGVNTGPWLTLRKAGLAATAGATVHVADGTYRVNGTLGSASSIESRNSGTPNAWITYVSDNKWAAKIINTNAINSPNNIAWAVEGDYQIVKDFDISGGPYTGIFVNANHVQVIGNHLHDISSTSCIAGSFIYVNSPHQYVDAIGNVMHDGGMKPWPSDCIYWHGIYYGGVTGGPVQYGQISNNIIYRISGWGIHFWHKVSHIDVLNNLIFSNVHGGILIGASGSTNDYFNVNNNLVIYNSNMHDNTGGPGSLGWGISEYVSDGGSIGSHNSYLNNLVYENHASNGWGGNWGDQAAGTNPTGVISGTVIAEPLLTNYQNSPAAPTISNGKVVFFGADYHPTSISPAKNAGDGAITLPTDIDGTTRPPSEAYDIGPY